MAFLAQEDFGHTVTMVDKVASEDTKLLHGISPFECTNAMFELLGPMLMFSKFSS